MTDFFFPANANWRVARTSESRFSRRSGHRTHFHLPLLPTMSFNSMDLIDKHWRHPVFGHEWDSKSYWALSEFWGGFHQSTEAPRAPKRRFGAQRPVLTDKWQTSTRTASLKNIKMRLVQICRFFRPLKKSAMADGAPPSLHLNSLGACPF